MNDHQPAASRGIGRDTPNPAGHPREFREATALTAARAMGRLVRQIETDGRYRFSVEDIRRIEAWSKEIIDLILEARIEPVIGVIE